MTEQIKLIPTVAGKEVLSLAALCNHALQVILQPASFTSEQRMMLAETIQHALEAEDIEVDDHRVFEEDIPETDIPVSDCPDYWGWDE